MKEEILKYRGSIGESESDSAASYNPCPDFENSVNADFEAAQGVLDMMDFRTVARFIEFLENCKGSVLVSGIGNCFQFLVTNIGIVYFISDNKEERLISEKKGGLKQNLIVE